MQDSHGQIMASLNDDGIPVLASSIPAWHAPNSTLLLMQCLATRILAVAIKVLSRPLSNP